MAISSSPAGLTRARRSRTEPKHAVDSTVAVQRAAVWSAGACSAVAGDRPPPGPPGPAPRSSRRAARGASSDTLFGRPARGGGAGKTPAPPDVHRSDADQAVRVEDELLGRPLVEVGGARG